MNRITFCESVGIDGEGFRQRLKGRDIRDCILVLTPEGGPSFGLLHKEPSSLTFVEEEIRGNKGALNIDSCRVTSSGDHKRPFQPTNSDRDIYGKQVGFQPTNSEGRFPANLVLMHDSKCVKSGLKKVKNLSGSVTHDNPRDATGKVYGAFTDRKDGFTAYGENGMETVDNWECVEHCPVGRLDSQSGVLHSRKDLSIRKSPDAKGYSGGWGTGQIMTTYGDSGGASRFFKQVTSQEELQSYFESLTRQGKPND